MKFKFFLFSFLISLFGFSQNIQVDSQAYSAQQLIEDIFIDNDCIKDVVVTNVITGDFGNADKSYGYFDASGTSFPIQNGIVMSTGRLSNVPGPNISLSNDDAPNWDGDADLEKSLSEGNTINATIIEFEFTSVANQIQFKYLFASEEYQENDSNTCNYSDLFGFLIRPKDSVDYTNIALIPNTQTPVKVTTVHPEIPNGCDAINESFFGSWNGTTAPINFNGQTKILTATANIVPNRSYHIKLVIADAQNFRNDSAVFLEANSFELTTDLGPDRLVATNSPVCKDEILQFNVFQPNNKGYVWYKDGVLVKNQAANCLDCGAFNVTEPGTYGVEVTLANGCVAYGEIVVEYAENPVATNASLVACDENQDGITFYDLLRATKDLTGNDDALLISNFYTSIADAKTEINAIQNPSNFQNTTPLQTIFGRVENRNGCFAIAELELEISNNIINVPPLNACDTDVLDGFTTFDLNEITRSIQNQIPINALVSFYENESDAFSESNPITTAFENTIENSQTIYVKVNSNNSCYSITTAQLNVLSIPILKPDTKTLYCSNSYPKTIRLFGDVLNSSPNSYGYQWFYEGSDTGVNTFFIDINEVGSYSVIVTSPNGCSASRTVVVSPSNLASITTISVDEGSRDNTIAVTVSGDGDYEFALNDINGPYQNSNVFIGIAPGFHTVYVRDINGCGITKEVVSVLGFPKYFTPNGDGINDTWNLYGVNDQSQRHLIIKIYNRYGKLMFEQKDLSRGWNGIYNGKSMPADDYWFEISLEDGTSFSGHFSLVR